MTRIPTDAELQEEHDAGWALAEALTQAGYDWSPVNEDSRLDSAPFHVLEILDLAGFELRRKA